MAMLLPRGVRRLSELIYVPLPRLRSISPSCSRTESACRTVWRLYPNCSESVFSDSMRSPGSYSPFLIFSLMVSTRKRYFAVFFSVSAMSSFLSKRIPVCTGSIQPYYKKPYNFLQDLSQNLYGLIFKIFCKIPQNPKILRKPPSSIAPQRLKPFEKAGENFTRPLTHNYTEKPPCGKTPARRR